MKEEIPIEALKRYENKWVAILEPDKKIVGSGDDASEAKKNAEKLGYKNFILLKMMSFHAGYIPCL